MSSALENTVFDFDLDFLHPPSTNNAEPDLQAKSTRLRKSIIFLKQRIMKVDKLAGVSKTLKKENEALCNNHMQIKQQCGQYLIEISYFIGKVTKLENEIQAAETREREKIETICELENKILALESVINQLKIVDKERNKTESTPLKVEIKKGKAGVTTNAKKGLVEKELVTLRKDNAKILNLEKENEKLRKENARIPNLEKEIENLCKKNSLLSKSVSISHNEIARIQKLEKEIENLYKENAKIRNFEKEIENLQKENIKIPKLKQEIENLKNDNARITKLMKEIENLQNENIKIPKLKQEIENLQKDNAIITKLMKEIENLQKENIKIPKLKQEIENLQKDNAIITKLMKEIENLQKENAKIPKLVKEIEILHKENAKITKLANDETVLKHEQNFIISNLEKDIETLRIKNAKLEIDKALSRDIVNIPNKGKYIETRLIDLTSTTKEKGKLRPKLRKYKSLPNVIGEWTDNSEAENNVFEDPLLSPTRNDTITAKECPIADNDIAVTSEFENDNSNEDASVDTGRGSSLTTSDTDKGLHSPEYFLNCSPSNGINSEIKAKTKDATMIRRPIETPTITIVEHAENQNAGEANSMSHRKRHFKLMSTVHQINAAREVFHSPEKRIQSVQEKECLEMNRLQCESHTDLELENIFNTMKLNYNAVSPIPSTPMLVHETDSTSSSSEANERFKRYSGLCCKTFDVMRIFMGLVASQGPDNNSSIMNKWDKLIESFESISKSEQSKYMTDSNMEISDSIQNRRLSHDDNELVSIPNPESTTSSSEKETEIFQNKKSDNLISQNVSLQNENLNQLPSDNNNSVVTISNPSSPDNNTNILINKRVENQKQLLNHSVCEEFATDSETSEVNDSVRRSRDIVEINQPLIKKSVGKKAINKKITKLEKLKKKLKPKYKIKMDPENIRNKPKPLFPIKKKLSVNDTSATLNDKEAYEKAVKFMAKMKSQQAAKVKSPKHTKVLMSPTRTAYMGKDINNRNDNQVLQDCSITTRNKRKISELFDSCPVVSVKDPLLLSPCKAKNSTTLKANDDNNSTTPACLGKDINNRNDNQVLQDCSITTRNKRKISELFDSCPVVLVKDPLLLSPCKAKNSTTLKADDDNNSTTPACLGKDINNRNDDQVLQDCPIPTPNKKKISELFDSCPVVLVKDPLLLSPCKAKNSTTLKADDDNNSTTHIPKEHTNSSTYRAKEDNNATTYRTEEDSNSTTHRVMEDNNSITHRAKEDNNSMIRRENENNNSATHRAKEDNNSTTYRAKEDTNFSTHRAKKDTNSLTYRSKEDTNSTTHRAKEDTNSSKHRAKEDNNATTHRTEEDTNSSTHRAKEDNNATTHRTEEDSNSWTHRAKEDNNATTHRTEEDTNSSTHRAKEDNNSLTHKGEENNKSSDELPSRKRRKRSSNEPVVQYKRVLRSATIHTRLSTEDNIVLPNSKGKSNRKSIIDPSTNDSGTQFNNKNTLQCLQLDRHDNNVVSYGDLDVFSEDIQLDSKMSAPVIAKEDSNSLTHRAKENNNSMTHKGAECNKSSDEPLRKRRRRSSNQPLIQYKRVLRSAPIHTTLSTEDNIVLSKSKGESSSSRKSIMSPNTNESDTKSNKENPLECLQLDRHVNNVVSYEDLDVFSEDVQLDKKMSAPVTDVNTDASACHPEESILCYMIQKHAREVARPYGKKISDKKINKVCEKIERDITTISEANNCLNAMNNFVADLRKLNHELFIEGLIKYLGKPERKFELLGKVVISRFSAMTKAEHILLYAIQQLESHWPSIVDDVLHSIEFTLFKLNRTPEFGVVESTSHFYALLCKNYNSLRRLKTFMLDAMYCIQFKSVPLIKQCLEVWKDLIPLPHMEVAKRPMVTCFIYLLHFYKCEDKLNRVQELRNILRYRYHYQFTNWNETKILEMFKNCIKGLKDISQEKKELRLALIILAKRNGAKWCQTHIIKNLLQPMIEKENVPNYVKEFCVSMIGPLMKPYPVDMKVHCEIAIMQLLDILNNNPSPEMEEAAITSMMYINRHDQRSINKTLLSRKMKPMSLRLEESIRYYVKSKPLKIWKTILLKREYACNSFSVNQ